MTVTPVDITVSYLTQSCSRSWQMMHVSDSSILSVLAPSARSFPASSTRGCFGRAANSLQTEGGKDDSSPPSRCPKKQIAQERNREWVSETETNRIHLEGKWNIKGKQHDDLKVKKKKYYACDMRFRCAGIFLMVSLTKYQPAYQWQFSSSFSPARHSLLPSQSLGWLHGSWASPWGWEAWHGGLRRRAALQRGSVRRRGRRTRHHQPLSEQYRLYLEHWRDNTVCSVISRIMKTYAIT